LDKLSDKQRCDLPVNEYTASPHKAPREPVGKASTGLPVKSAGHLPPLGCCRRFCGLLLARLLSNENQALILELLDWQKFQVRQIVYFPNGYCRRRCGFRDKRFRRRSASSRVQPKTYRHRGEPCGNAYDCASHWSLLPVRIEVGVPDFRAGNRKRSMSYVTLRGCLSARPQTGSQFPDSGPN